MERMTWSKGALMLKKKLTPEQIIDIAPNRGAFGPRQEHRAGLQGSYRAGIELGDQRLSWNSLSIGDFPSVTKVPSYRPACV